MWVYVCVRVFVCVYICVCAYVCVCVCVNERHRERERERGSKADTIQTHKRFKRTLFIRPKTCNFGGVIPVIKLQNNT